MIGALQPQIAQPEPRVFPFGIARQQLHVQPLGFFLLALLLEHAGQVVNHVRQIRRDLQSAFIGFARRLQVAHFLPHDSQIHMRLLGVGTDAHGFAISLGGFVQSSALLLAPRPD